VQNIIMMSYCCGVQAVVVNAAGQQGKVSSKLQADSSDGMSSPSGSTGRAAG